MPELTRLHENAIKHPVASPKQHPLSIGLLVAVFLALIAAIYCAYKPVLFGFFAGDDYAYLPWLKQAMRQPELVWRNFNHPWMDSQLTQFYRPMITATMALEYFFCGPNSLVYRLTNLGCLALGSLLLGLIAWDLARVSSIEKPSVAGRFAIVAAFLFALYPLHSEATVWLIGRVDSMCTMFSLASLWCYIRWRLYDNEKLLGLSILCSILAYTCKETSITVAPAVALCEIFFGNSFQNSPSQAPNNKSILSDLRRIALKTFPYFLLLGGYFLVRLVCFGTFIGGYDNSLALNDDLAGFATRIIHGLRMLVVPVNKDMLGAHDIFVRVWQVGIGLAGLLSLISAAIDTRARKIAGFASLWFVLALVPVYKVFTIADDLQGSRLGYLATVPFCMLIACGGLLTLNKHTLSRLLLPFYACVLFLAGTLLNTNNQAWAEAGRLSNNIQRQIGLLYETLPGDPPVLLVGVPISYKGAFVCLNALDGMTKVPQISRDIFNCYLLNDCDSVTPFGFLKTSMFDNAKGIKSFYWDSATQCLKPVAGDRGQTPFSASYQGKALNSIITAASPETSLRGVAGGGLLVSKRSSTVSRPELELNFKGLPCSSIDFVSLKLKQLGPDINSSDKSVLLLYSNNIISKFDSRYRTQASLDPSANEQEILLSLHSLPEWCFGGACRGLKLLLPANSNLVIEQLCLKPTDAVLPNFSFPHSGYLEKRGTLELNDTHDREIIYFDLSKVEGAVLAVCEITRPSGSFTIPNSKNMDSTSSEIKRIPREKGSFLLTLNDFPSKGLYQLRLRGLDKNNNPVGLASDNIVVSVSKNASSRLESTRR